MISLKIDNSECQIVGLSIEQHNKLKDLLSYSTSPRAAFFAGGYKNPKVSLLSRRGSFPTGLLNYVESFLKASKISHTTVDTRIVPKSNGELFKMVLR